MNRRKRGELLNAVREHLQQGRTALEISQLIGCPLTSVHTTARRLKLALPKPKVDLAFLAEVQRLQAQGKSQRDIAKELNTYTMRLTRVINAARREGLIPAAAPKQKKVPASDSLYSPQLKQEVRDLYHRDKMTIPALADLFAITQLQVRNMLSDHRVFGKSYGVTLRPDPQPRVVVLITDDVRARVLHLYNKDHYNVQAIADETGIEIGEAMEIVREDKYSELMAA